MDKKTNMVGLEGEDVSFEADALAEERENARANYQHLENELKDLEADLPYPEVKIF